MLAALTILIALCIATGAFYWGRHISGIEFQNKQLTATVESAEKHIADLEKTLEDLARENDYIQQELKGRHEQMTPPRAWNPGDPLNSGQRQ